MSAWTPPNGRGQTCQELLLKSTNLCGAPCSLRERCTVKDCADASPNSHYHRNVLLLKLRGVVLTNGKQSTPAGLACRLFALDRVLLLRTHLSATEPGA